MSDTTDDDGFRERVMGAVFSALQRVDGVEMIERNPLRDVEEDVPSALLFLDGDLDGETDRANDFARNPVFRMSYICEIQGGIQGGAGNPGTLINALWRKTVLTLWTDPQLRRFLAENSIGLRITQAAFPTPVAVGAKKAAFFLMLIELPFEFDPLDP